MSTCERYLAALKESGFRITPQRVAICDYLARTKEHPTAQRIFEELRPGHGSLSLTTVYMTLDTLAHLGQIVAIGGVGSEGVHFEPNPTPHVNLACKTCRRIIDLDVPSLGELEAEIGRQIGGRIREGSVMYQCDCIECLDPATCEHNGAGRVAAAG